MRPGPKPRPVAERLWDRVANLGGPGCWEWTGYRMASGHGQIGVGGSRTALTHRVAYEDKIGPIPDRMDVCHTCDNPPCCRPDHFFLGTRADNNRDAAGKGRMHPGSANGQSKLTEEQVARIRARLRDGQSSSEIAAAFDVCPSTVSLIGSGHTWRHVGAPDRAEQLPVFEGST